MYNIQVWTGPGNASVTYLDVNLQFPDNVVYQQTSIMQVNQMCPLNNLDWKSSLIRVYTHGFPSALYFKSPRDPHKNFLRVQRLKSRVLNHGIFLLHIQIKNQNCLNVQCESNCTEYFQVSVMSIRILHFLINFPFLL